MYIQYITLILALLFLTPISQVMATNPPFLQLLFEDENGLLLELTRPPVEVETIQMRDRVCQRIHVPTWGKTLAPGYPELPVKSTLLQVPLNRQPTAKPIQIEEKVLPNVELCPTPTQRISENGEITLQFINLAYQTAEFFPSQRVKIATPAILRGVPVSRLQIFPFQWNPVTKELRYADKIQFEIQFEKPLNENFSSSPTPVSREVRRHLNTQYEKFLAKTLLNYHPLPQPNLPYSQKSGGLNLGSVRQKDSVSVDEYVKPSDALRIEITEAGIYQLSYQDLVDAGLQPQWLNPQRLRLFNQGEEVAIQVITQISDQFQPGDTIQFYAQGINNRFTDTNVYWFYWRKKGFGKRMTQIDGTPTEQSEPIGAFYKHLHFEQDRQTWLETPNAPEQDYWFWQRLNASEAKEFSLNTPSPFSQATDAMIRIQFQGRSTASPHPNHHTLIKLNGTVIGDEFWDGDSTHIQEMSISPTLFNHGENTLTVEMPGDTGAIVDVIYLNWIEVNYWRTFEAVKDNLLFTVNGNGDTQITVTKLTQPDIVIYDLTNPNEVAEIINFSVAGEAKDYQATFTDYLVGDKTYYLSTTQQIQSPAQLTAWKPLNLKGPKNRADYILITDAAFLPAVQPLTTRRRQQGLHVKAVSVQDIYNEFNAGLFDPAAIKDFLHYAYHNWNHPAPTYVFLVGDANLDYQEKTKKINKMPTHLSGSYDGLTPDDNWYVSVDGDDNLPDMFIGRIPGDTPETVAQLIDKIIRFEQSTHENPQKVLLIADSDPEFEELNEDIIKYLPTGFHPEKIYLRTYLAGVEKEQRDQKIAQATRYIMSSFNDGVMISNYIGHGVVDRWSQSKGLFTPENVQKLRNEEQLAFTLMLTCINGYFVDPQKYSFAEEFILARGGAIGAFAPSNVSYAWEDQILADAIFSTIFEQGNTILGAITTQSKIIAYEQGASQNVMQMFTLFGDPAVSLKAW